MDHISHVRRTRHSSGPQCAAGLPPLPKIAAALREVTEILAFEISAPTEQPPLWGEFEWRIARAVASMQGVSSLLCTGLRWRGPEGWRWFLEAQRDHVTGRHRKIAQLLDTIDAQARNEGIALVALKGAALHSTGIYQPGERPMADVDLLARDDDVQGTVRVLEACGFESTFTTWRNQFFESRSGGKSIAASLGENVDNPIKVELHTSIRERLPISEADITRFIFPHAPHAGLNPYRSAASLMMHLLLHAAGNMRAHALRLIQLHDIARLAQRFGSSDWEELLTARPDGRSLWWAVPPLMLIARYYPAAIPGFVIAGLREDCPWLLARFARRQRLADVSWSDIRVHALPGIEWSRTPQEALRFAVSRIWPSRDDRFELRHFAAHHPGASEIPWYGISQGARIFRWVFSRPPRVQTLLSVRAALADEG
jgi:Uncharacterised nucleotidyltransferase